jgi:PAS domain S-box-containing protein
MTRRVVWGGKGVERLASRRRQLGDVLKEPHFWVILAIMTCGTIFYYADQIPVIDTLESSLRLDFARHSVHRILSVLPVAYAAYVFGLAGGLLASCVIAALLLPRAFLIPSESEEAAIEVAAFLFIGAFVSWLIDVQNKEKARHKQTIASLEWAQGELQSHLQAIENEERRLSAINAVLGVVTESLELQDILGLAMDKVSDVMGVEICLLFLLQEEAGELTLEAYHGMADESAAAIKPIKVGEGFNGRVAQTGEPLAVRDFSDEMALYRGVGGLGEIHTELVVPLKSKGRVMGTLHVATRSLREFSADETEVLNAIGNAIGVAIENARLYQKERETADQLRQSEENYRGLFENATEAIIVQNLDGRITAANSACERLTGYTRAEMSSMDIGSFVSGQGQYTVKEIVKRLLKGEAIEGPFELGLTKRDGTQAIVELMPSLIIRGERPIGVQAIVRDVTEQRRMQENLRFYISEVLKAQEGERLRIARELHDDTAQALTGLSRRLDMLVDTLASSGNQVPKEIPGRLEELREQSDRILEGVRRFSRDLRPPVLDDLGLLPAVKWLATALEEQHGIAANIRVLGEQHRLPDEAELALFRIAQEALNNVRKHSGASAVEVTVDFRDGGITMIVADNGSGFEPPRSTSDLAASGKLGIIGMQERIRLLGGTLAVHSEPGAGTRVVVAVPAQASSLSSSAYSAS